MSMLLRLSLVVATLASCALEAQAQGAVETYVDQAVPPPAIEGEWNKPLKAGALTLAKPDKPHSKAPSRAPSLPVGALKAPQIQTSGPQPLLAPPRTSASNVMLMQGMKTALQQGGQNPDVPKSSLPARDADQPAPQPPLVPPQLQPAAKTEETKTADSTKYETGHEPRNLGNLAASQSPEKAEEPLKPSATMADAASPKATELDQAPVPLEHASTQPPKPEAPVAKPAEESIFGKPVAESETTKPPMKMAEAKIETLPEPPTAPPAAPPAPPCVPEVAYWTKECRDAGYPENATGQIRGETRTTCPDGETKDVWLSNSCAVPSNKEEPKEIKAEESLKTAAPEAPKPGAACGSAAETAAFQAPADNLCTIGTASVVTGEGPWNWSCAVEVGASVSCSTLKAEEAIAPAAGTAIPPLVEAKPPAPAPKPEEPKGQCGSAAGVSAAKAPASDLCAVGKPSKVRGKGAWIWTCGQSKKAKVTCKAPHQVAGTCGSANGLATSIMPSTGLCAAGTLTGLDGNGPWTWRCEGLEGGEAASCSAPLAMAEEPKPAAEAAPAEAAHTPAPEAKPDMASSEGISVKEDTAPPPNAAAPAPEAKTEASASESKPEISSPENIPVKEVAPLPAMAVPTAEPEGGAPAAADQLAAKTDAAPSSNAQAPATAPELPEGTQALVPPPVRDNLQPPPALKPPSFTEEEKPLPRPKLKLDEDMATVKFDHGTDSLDEDATEAVKKLGRVLTDNAAARVTLYAYADHRGMTPRDARRLSLARALTIRDALTSQGIASSRIDVRALGANFPSGDGDRVDVKVN